MFEAVLDAVLDKGLRAVRATCIMASTPTQTTWRAPASTNACPTEREWQAETKTKSREEGVTPPALRRSRRVLTVTWWERGSSGGGGKKE